MSPGIGLYLSRRKYRPPEATGDPISTISISPLSSVWDPKKRPSGKPKPIQETAGRERNTDRNTNSRFTSSSALTAPWNRMERIISTAPSEARKVVSSSWRTALAVCELREPTTVSMLRLAVHIQDRCTTNAVSTTAAKTRAVRATPRRGRKRRLLSAFAAGNEAGAALVGDIGPDPVDENRQPILETNQEPDMCKTPQ